jgi:hypothetical protein
MPSHEAPRGGHDRRTAVRILGLFGIVVVVAAVLTVVVPGLMRPAAGPAVVPPAVAATSTLPAVADATVDEGAPTRRHASAPVLLVDGDHGFGHDYWTYLAFDLGPAAQPIRRATLRLYVLDATSESPTVAATSATWTEADLTWETKPSPGASSVGGGTASVPNGTWFTIDVTKLMPTAGGVSLVLRLAGENGLEVSSRDAANGPQLVVERGGTTAPGAGEIDDPAPNVAASPTAGRSGEPAGPAGSSAVLVGAGDIAACGRTGDDATAALIDGIAGTVFTLGDNAYEDGTIEQFRECYDPSWGRFKARTRPVPGNHEYHTPNAQGYRDYFGVTGVTWYAYDAGSWRVYALDSNCSHVGGCGPGSPQHEWLRRDLEANPRTCSMAYWHHPKWTVGPHEDDEGGAGVFWSLLHEHGVELVVTGHDHNYQRWTTMLPDGTPAPDGIRLIINGAGGKNVTTQDESDPRVEARNDDTVGVLKLTLGPASYEWAFVPEAGKTFRDGGTTACH